MHHTDSRPDDALREWKIHLSLGQPNDQLIPTHLRSSPAEQRLLSIADEDLVSTPCPEDGTRTTGGSLGPDRTGGITCDDQSPILHQTAQVELLHATAVGRQRH